MRVVLNEQSLIGRLRRRNLDLQTALDTLRATTHRLTQTEELTRTDELTGLANRRGFHLHLQTRRRTDVLVGRGLLLIDCDRFKGINDDHGHLTGDRVLQGVANILRSAAGPDDIACRLGGDEFCLMIKAESAADVMLKKTSPSGGAMHPTEAYFIVHRVEGLLPGLYHYNSVEHALQPLPWTGTPEELEAFARLAVGGQQWFSESPVQVVLVPRFARNFWKYQNHPKAYRVAILDIGHLSQTLLITATELGLGAFVTAAINEIDIEREFGLTSYIEGPIAVCGFGARAETMTTPELDPNRTSWPRKPQA